MTSDERNCTVGFIGLGAMGGPMSERLLRGGHPLVVYDIDGAKNRRLAEVGARVGDGPADVARQSRIVVTMVETTEQTRSVVASPGGVIDEAQAGDVLVCMSTIDPTALGPMQQALSDVGADLIDAPVSGLLDGAKDGTLTALVGGNAGALESCRHVLEAMTRRIVHVGPLGQGMVVKLINNMMYHANFVAALEGMILGVKAGVRPDTIIEAVEACTGSTPAFRYHAPRMINRDFEGMRLEVFYDNLMLETALGRSLNVPLFLPGVCAQIFEMGRAAGLGSQDATALVEVYERISAVSIENAS